MTIEASSQYDYILYLQNRVYSVGKLFLEASNHRFAAIEPCTTEGNKEQLARMRLLQRYLATLINTTLWNLPAARSLNLAQAELEYAQKKLDKLGRKAVPGKVIEFGVVGLQKSLLRILHEQLYGALKLLAKIKEGKKLLEELEEQLISGDQLQRQFRHNYERFEERLHREELTISKQRMPEGYAFELLANEFAERKQKEQDIHHDNLMLVSHFAVAMEELDRQYFVFQNELLADIIHRSHELDKTLNNTINYTEDVLDPQKVFDIHRLIHLVGKKKEHGKEKKDEFLAVSIPVNKWHWGKI